MPTAIFRETGGRNDEGRALASLGVVLRKVRRFRTAFTAYRDVGMSSVRSALRA
jgi:hypothetical protein